MTEIKKVDLASLIACEQALRGALRRAGKRKESQCNCVSEIFIPPPCGIPSTELVDFRQSARRENELECKQTLKNTWKHASIARLIFNVISANQHFTRLFQCRNSNFRDVVANSPSFSCLTARAPLFQNCLQRKIWNRLLTFLIIWANVCLFFSFLFFFFFF